MLKHVLVCAAFVASATAGSLHAQQSLTAAQDIKQAPQQKMQVPDTNYEFVLGSVEFLPGGSTSTESLLTSLVFWISDNFDLSAVYDRPRIERMSSIEMTNLLYQSFLGGQRREMSVPENHGNPTNEAG